MLGCQKEESQTMWSGRRGDRHAHESTLGDNILQAEEQLWGCRQRDVIPSGEGEKVGRSGGHPWLPYTQDRIPSIRQVGLIPDEGR